MIKKIIEGVFAPIYYNECEACSPLGINIKQARNNGDCTLCDILKEELNIEPDMFNNKHELIGKKIKITIEIEE